VPPDAGALKLLGGAVGYFLDRKAAVLSYAHGRHAVTLLAVPATGLDWPGPDRVRGAGAPRVETARGFRAVFWRAGDLGYVAVTDVSLEELGPMVERLAAATAAAPAP
jgi:anti-sigma factor RsiW